jgi:hypothetical protein
LLFEVLLLVQDNLTGTFSTGLVMAMSTTRE